MSSERIESFYRDATEADVARVMNGETVEARFQDHKNLSWFYSNLSGWRNGLFPWGDEALYFWSFCQVYDPPQWFIDKPEPGEGYRLLGKFPAEDLQEGDELLAVDGSWLTSRNVEDGMGQSPHIWYRRRIEQPKPGPKHYTLQVGDTIETPILLRIIVTEHGIEVQ